MNDKYGKDVVVGDMIATNVLTGKYEYGRVSGFYETEQVRGFHVQFPNENYDNSPGDFICENEAILCDDPFQSRLHTIMMPVCVQAMSSNEAMERAQKIIDNGWLYDNYEA